MTSDLARLSAATVTALTAGPFDGILTITEGDLQGGDGDDRLHGGDGNDTLHGGEGYDDLMGGADATCSAAAATSWTGKTTTIR